MSLVLALYRTATWLAGPLARPILDARARAGKEDPQRLGERFGHASAPRPEGLLVWLHGASVGETRVLMLLQAAFAVRRPDISFLFTSGTRTSAGLFARMPSRSVHQYTPLDRPDVAQRFLAHWRPDLSVFAESEIWPNLLLATAGAKIPLALINARMSPKTLAFWRSRPAAGRKVFGCFTRILAADSRTAEGLSALLGAPVPSPGNLKLAAGSPRIDEPALAALRSAIGARPIWLAASTHPGEDEILLAAHQHLRTERPDALLILAPRHPERGDAIAALANGAPRRSLGAGVGQTPVYVADTMGELNLFYAAAPVAFIGGSLLPRLRGHNPAEPAMLGCAILSGPYVESFADVFEALFSSGGAVAAASAESIAREVARLWAQEDARLAAIRAASDAMARGESSLAITVDALESLLPPSSPTNRADAAA
jgi:3-deoxy-D-manno-octulosonic-acid transferase